MFQPQVWSVGELRVFLDFVADDELCALWSVLALTGVRRGEALGLQWGDLSPRYSHVAVRRALINAGGSIYLTSPKAVQSRRIDLDGRTKAALHRHRREQLRRARTGSYKVGRSSFIFRKRNGEWLTPSSVSRRFVQLSAEAGLPRIRLHDLRHTHASHLLEAGANVKAVQERLGHSHPVVTMDTYVHLFPTIQAEAVKKLDQYYREDANT